MRSAAGSGRSMIETRACDAGRESRTHMALAPAGWLMAILRAAVYSCGCFDENVLDLREFRDVSLRCRITAQLIRHDLPRHRVRLQQSKRCLAAALSRRFCTGTSSSAPCSSTARHNRNGSSRSVTNISSMCHVRPGLHRAP